MIETGSKVLSQVVQQSGRPHEPTRLLVVDDHAAVRAGVRDMLADEPDFDVVAAVPTAEEGLSVVERHVIDLAVVDYQLDGRSGLWLSRKLKRLPRPPRVVIYSAYCDGLLAAAAHAVDRDAADTRRELPTAAELGALLDARTGADVGLSDLRWVSPFKMHKRAVKRLSDGRRFLRG